MSAVQVSAACSTPPSTPGWLLVAPSCATTSRRHPPGGGPLPVHRLRGAPGQDLRHWRRASGH
eukprot:14031078-Alexandrium_andersonii.AAC.1